jgi:hypothetical protein
VSTVLEHSPEWRVARELLIGRETKRTGVNYFQHVEEGVKILQAIGAAFSTQKAFCIHPLVQCDEDLLNSLSVLHRFCSRSVALAFEYRWVANRGTRQHVCQDWIVQLSVWPAVNQMLVADKVQNCKDFRQYYTAATHPMYAELDRYFQVWFDALHIDNAQYESLVALLGAK